MRFVVVFNVRKQTDVTRQKTALSIRDVAVGRVYKMN